MGLLAALLFAGIGLQLANPLVLRAFIDAAASGRDLGPLLGGGALFLALAVLTQVLGLAETWVAENAGWTATNRLRADLAHHCLQLDLAFHTAHTPGELIERIDGDVTALANFFSRFLLLVVGNSLLLAGMLGILFLTDWRVGLALLGFAACALIVLRRSGAWIVPALGASRQASADLYGFLEERLAGLEDLRASGAGAYVMRRFHERLRDAFHKMRRVQLLWSLVVLIGVGLFTLGYLLAVALGAALFTAGAISLGTVYLVIYYAQMLERPLNAIADQIGDLQKARASLLRVRELQAIAPVIAGGAGGTLPSGPLAVEFAGVTFGYGAGAPVLHDLALRLAPGRALGVVGRTGSGKTTLARLLLRLYDPDAGAIRVGGVDVRNLPLAALRGRIGVVTQDVQLFAASLRDNLTLFAGDISDAQIVAALHDLGLGDWYAALAQGLDTELEAGGAGLSAGEAQLLAFARVFLRDPGLVILDEASSRLDPATERRIERAVSTLLRGRTAVVIAHRLATIARADEILVLEGGRVAEQGPRARLVANPDSRFAGLLRVGLGEEPA
jgi:ATP-binding cassette subfamily B protein